MALGFKLGGLGGGSADDLYEALKYSGLVTPDMDYDQMLEVLANYFPFENDILSKVMENDISYLGGSTTRTSYTSTYAKNNLYFYVKATGQQYGANAVWTLGTTNKINPHTHKTLDYTLQIYEETYAPADHVLMSLVGVNNNQLIELTGAITPNAATSYTTYDKSGSINLTKYNFTDTEYSIRIRVQVRGHADGSTGWCRIRKLVAR